MEKLDLKKQWKHLYQPKTGTIVAVDVPPLTYLMVDGEGDPNTSQAYREGIVAAPNFAERRDREHFTWTNIKLGPCAGEKRS